MRFRPSRFVAILAVLGAFALGTGGGSLWRESATACALTGVLLEDIRSLLEDGRAVVTDPFLEYAMGTDESFTERIELHRELSQRIRSRFSRFHISVGFLMDLGKLSELESKSLEAHLDALEGWQRAMNPAPQAAEQLLQNLEPVHPPGAAGTAPGQAQTPWYSDPVLARAHLRTLAEADHRRLLEARERVPALRADWTEDNQVYCRSILTLHRMTQVADTQKQGCAEHKKKAACAASTRFQAEVDQLEKVKSLNERKLKLKWGRKLYAGIRCD